MAVNWRRTGGMQNLLDQFNARWPNRDKASDGSVGDFAHTQEHSGHNPDDTDAHNAEWDGDPDNVPEVRAIDVDDDLREAGTSMQDVINHMRTLTGLSSVIRYMIFNRKIYRASNGFRPEVYTGASAHTEHAHFSGAYSQASDNNTTFNFRFDQVGAHPMAELTSAQVQAAAADAIEGFFADANFAALNPGSATQPQRFARDALRNVVGGPVDQGTLLAAIASDNVNTQALADALLPGLSAAVTAAVAENLPEGTLTAEEVQTAAEVAVRTVLGQLDNA